MNRNFTTPQLWGVAWIVERPLQHSGWRRSEFDLGIMVSMITHDWICWIRPCNKKGWLHFCNNRILLVITVTYDDIWQELDLSKAGSTPRCQDGVPNAFARWVPLIFELRQWFLSGNLVATKERFEGRMRQIGNSHVVKCACKTGWCC